MSQSAVGYDNAHITALPNAWTSVPKVSSPAPEWRPEMVTTPPSQAELAEQARDAEARRQASLRPADKSVEAVQVALDNIVRERAVADHRLSARRDAVARLLDGNYHLPADIKAANDALGLAEIEAEQYGRMEDGMRASLTRALDEEVAEHKAKIAQLAAAEATVDAYRKFITKRYPALGRRDRRGSCLGATGGTSPSACALGVPATCRGRSNRRICPGCETGWRSRHTGCGPVFRTPMSGPAPSNDDPDVARGSRCRGLISPCAGMATARATRRAEEHKASARRPYDL